MELANRISLDHIESCIHAVEYTTLRNTASEVAAPVTICHVMLKNGKNVIGINYGAIDPEQHSAEMGKKEAYKQAIDKLFELEGYALINRHFETGSGLLIENKE